MIHHTYLPLQDYESRTSARQRPPQFAGPFFTNAAWQLGFSAPTAKAKRKLEPLRLALQKAKRAIRDFDRDSFHQRLLGISGLAGTA